MKILLIIYVLCTMLLKGVDRQRYLSYRRRLAAFEKNNHKNQTQKICAAALLILKTTKKAKYSCQKRVKMDKIEQKSSENRFENLVFCE